MKKMNKNFINNAITYGMVIVAFIVMMVLQEAGMLSRSMRGQLIPICVYIVMAVSLNLTVGISGELSLGHAGFMSIGAFTGITGSAWLLARFNIDDKIIRLLLSLVVGGAFAGFAGFLIGIPVLRLRGDYLAIVTLAFGEIIRNILNCLYVSLDGPSLNIAFNSADIPGKMLIKGPTGATGNPKLATFAVGFGLVLFTLFVVLNLKNSRAGRAIMAGRDNRIAAESMGINVTKYKMIAFVTSAVLAGMAGALYGANFSSFAASKFKFDTSILILVFVVLGGIGSIRGSVIAAIVLTLLPELLREFDDYRMLVYAVVLIVMMLLTNSPFVKMIAQRITGVFKKTEKEDGANA